MHTNRLTERKLSNSKSRGPHSGLEGSVPSRHTSCSHEEAIRYLDYSSAMINGREEPSSECRNTVVSLNGHLESDAWLKHSEATEVIVLLDSPCTEGSSSCAEEPQAFLRRFTELLRGVPKHINKITIWLSAEGINPLFLNLTQTQDLVASILACPAQLEAVDFTGAALHALAVSELLASPRVPSVSHINSLALGIDCSTLTQPDNSCWTPGVPEQVTRLHLHFLQPDDDASADVDLAFSPDAIYDAHQLQALALTAAVIPRSSGSSSQYHRPARLSTAGLARLSHLTSLTLDGFLPPHGTRPDHPDPSKEAWDALADEGDPMVARQQARPVPGPGPQALVPWNTLCQLEKLQRLVLPSLTIEAAAGQVLQHLQHVSVGCLVVDATSLASHGRHEAVAQQEGSNSSGSSSQAAASSSQAAASSCQAAAGSSCLGPLCPEPGLLVQVLPSLQELQVLQEGSTLHWLAGRALRGHPRLRHLRAPVAATWRCHTTGHDALRVLPSLDTVHAAVQDPIGHKRPKDTLLALVLSGAARCLQLRHLTVETSALLSTEGAAALEPQAGPDTELELTLLCQSCGSAWSSGKVCSRQEQVVQHIKCESGCTPAVAALLCGAAGQPRRVRRLRLPGLHLAADVQELAARLGELLLQPEGDAASSRQQRRRRTQRVEDVELLAVQLEHLAQLVLDGTVLVQQVLEQAGAGGALQAPAAAGPDAGAAVASQLGAGAAMLQLRSSLRAAGAKLQEVLAKGQWAGLERGQQLRALVDQVVGAVQQRQKQGQQLYRALLWRPEPLVAVLPGGCELQLGVLG